MAVTKEALAIVLDVGKSMHNDKGCPTILEEAKKCISMIVQRKIFSESKDEMALILFGTPETVNKLSDQYPEEYSNITVTQDLQLASWELLKSISEVQGTDISADFIDALVVAMDVLYLKLREDKEFSGRILIFSDFCSPFSANQLDKICRAIKFTKMELNIMFSFNTLEVIRDNALLTAIHLLQSTISGKKFFSRRILFISCFDGYIYSNRVDKICDELKKHKIDLNVIGPVAFPTEDIKNGTCMASYSNENLIIPEKNENCITKILREVNGESYSFSDVLPALIYYQKKKVQAIPWNANLDIGTNLSIPISAYIKVSENKPKAWKSAYAFKLNAKIERGTTYHINDEFGTKVSKDDIIPAFKYGTTLVPYSEEDKVNMDYQSGEKGMKVLGFTKAENVQRYHYIGDKTMYIFGQKNRELAGVILAPFIQALHDTKMVAIVRYVYSQRSVPKIGFLAPKIKENYECLIFVALPFMEDLHHFLFTSLDSDPKNVPSEEQLTAVDELITAMDLTVPVSSEDEEILKPKNTVNPYLQHLCQCLQCRVLNPEKPVPGVEPHIEALVTPKPKLLKRAETSLKRIKSLFPIKETASKKQKQAEVESCAFPNRKSEDLCKKELMDLIPEEKPVTDTKLLDAVTDKIVEVGSVNPVRDFQYLINNKVLPFNDVCQQMMDVVVKFLQDNAHLRMYHSKILSICKEFRSASLKEGNSVKYNSFMTNLQNVLLECDEELWNKIRNEKIGLISKKEIPSSAVSEEQAEMFLANPSQSRDKSSLTVIESFDANEDEDYENLLEQL